MGQDATETGQWAKMPQRPLQLTPQRVKDSSSINTKSLRKHNQEHLTILLTVSTSSKRQEKNPRAETLEANTLGKTITRKCTLLMKLEKSTFSVSYLQ
jgi:hypothetical protein